MYWSRIGKKCIWCVSVYKCLIISHTDAQLNELRGCRPSGAPIRTLGLRISATVIHLELRPWRHRSPCNLPSIGPAPCPRTDANTGRVQLFTCCVPLRTTCGPERLLGASVSRTDSAAEMGRCSCLTIVISNITGGVGGGCLCLGSLLWDAGVKPGREAKVCLQLSTVPALFWPRGSAAQLRHSCKHGNLHGFGVCLRAGASCDVV